MEERHDVSGHIIVMLSGERDSRSEAGSESKHPYTNLSAAEWVKRIESNLAATQDALMADALSRNAAAFETLLTGNVSIGGIYDWWRKLQAWRCGERFQAEHSSVRGRP